MSIKQHLENALRSIETDKDRAIATAKEKCTREKIIPHNADVDRSLNEATNALTAKLNQDIAKLQETFNAEKQAMIEASNKKKTEYASQIIATETSIVAMEYDKAVAELRKQIDGIKE